MEPKGDKEWRLELCPFKLDRWGGGCCSSNYEAEAVKFKHMAAADFSLHESAEHQKENLNLFTGN